MPRRGLSAIRPFESSHEQWRKPVDFVMAWGTRGGDVEPGMNFRLRPRENRGSALGRHVRVEVDHQARITTGLGKTPH